MATHTDQDQRLEIVHVLFLDIVGYSKLLTNEQGERPQELNHHPRWGKQRLRRTAALQGRRVQR